MKKELMNEYKYILIIDSVMSFDVCCVCLSATSWLCTFNVQNAEYSISLQTISSVLT